MRTKRPQPTRRPLLALGLAAVVALAAGCGGDDTTSPDTTGAEVAASSTTTSAAAPGTDGTAEEAATDGDLFPDVLSATATQSSDGTWTFDATLSSPYDSPDRYADAWRVIGADGRVYGIRELTHDHAGEQPFTRSQSGIEIPDDVEIVTVEGRDQISGWGGATVEVVLDR